MTANFVSIGAVCAALGIVLGAFGAHALRGAIGDPQLILWETATRYWLTGSAGMILFGLFRASRAGSSLPGWLLLGSSVLFAASLYALALGAPRAIGAATPLGGLGLISGFLSFAWLARRP